MELNVLNKNFSLYINNSNNRKRRYDDVIMSEDKDRCQEEKIQEEVKNNK